MLKLLLPLLMIFCMAMPAQAEQDNQMLVIYEGLHIPIKFAEKTNLSKADKDEQVIIKVNEDVKVDEHIIFEEESEGYVKVLDEGGIRTIKKGQLIDVFGNDHDIKVSGFNLKDFKEDNQYIIPEGYVIDSFIEESMKIKK